MEDRQALIVYLPQAIRRAIQEQADKEDRSASYIARRALTEKFGPKK